MRKELEETLELLHEQLAEAKELSPDDQDRLRQAATEIRESLNRQDVSSHSLAERLRNATEEFQSSHPYLTQTVGRIADLLAQMGI